MGISDLGDGSKGLRGGAWALESESFAPVVETTGILRRDRQSSAVEGLESGTVLDDEQEFARSELAAARERHLQAIDPPARQIEGGFGRAIVEFREFGIGIDGGRT
jgi:hypothetical protein